VSGKWVEDGTLLGYVVAEINQASGMPENVTADIIHSDLEWARHLATEHTAENRQVGRREQYVVCELVPVPDSTEEKT
jgi:hypothetical protein